MVSKEKKINDDYNVDTVLKETQDKLDRPDKFADIFCSAAKSQIQIKECLVKIIKEVILTDKETYSLTKNIVKEVEQEYFFAFIKKISFLGWTALVGFVGALGGFLLKTFSK